MSDDVDEVHQTSIHCLGIIRERTRRNILAADRNGNEVEAYLCFGRNHLMHIVG